MNKTNAWIVLIPIWGAMHIKMCAESVLPALLAPGNLPHISSKNKIIVRFLTTQPSALHLRESHSYEELSRYADISFCFIDDLVLLGDYGIILTLAYERGIQLDSPEIQTQHCYVFINGDMVLSNNTFVTLAKYINEGFSAIVAPSLRIIDQDAYQLLTIQSDKLKSVIDCSGRELVKYTLDHLHPTVVASMLDKQDIGTNISHQYFIRVSKSLLIARYFLMFMLCIKPERALKEVTSHCDYSFIPELCPSGNYKIISDSDEIFLMELAPIEQESSHIYWGQKNIEKDIIRMKTWVTKEHAKYSEQTIYFHSAPLPDQGIEYENLSASKTKMDKILNMVYEGLAKAPRISHEYHYFWISVINMLKNHGKLIGRDSINNSFLKNLLNSIFRYMFGKQPFVSKLHYKYQDYKVCLNTIKSKISDNSQQSILYICGDRRDVFKSFFDRIKQAATKFIGIDDLNYIDNIDTYNLIFVECNQFGFNKFAKFAVNNNLDFSKIVIYVDLISPGIENIIIKPYLCLLGEKYKFNRNIVGNAFHKWIYHKSSAGFLNQVYAERSLTRMAIYFMEFSVSLIFIMITNNLLPFRSLLMKLSSPLRKDQIEYLDLHKLSSITLTN
jgi:hypothetical protein